MNTEGFPAQIQQLRVEGTSKAASNSVWLLWILCGALIFNMVLFLNSHKDLAVLDRAEAARNARHFYPFSNDPSPEEAPDFQRGKNFATWLAQARDPRDLITERSGWDRYIQEQESSFAYRKNTFTVPLVQVTMRITEIQILFGPVYLLFLAALLSYLPSIAADSTPQETGPPSQDDTLIFYALYKEGLTGPHSLLRFALPSLLLGIAGVTAGNTFLSFQLLSDVFKRDPARFSICIAFSMAVVLLLILTLISARRLENRILEIDPQRSR